MNKENKGKGCCKLNKVVLFLSTFVMLIALALSSYAVPFECNVSTYKTTIQGGASGNQVNITFSTGATVAADSTNLYGEIYIFSSSTANSSSTKLTANVSNSTSKNVINWTMPVGLNFIFEDADNYAINAMVWNGTANTLGQGIANYTGCNNATGFTIDRTVPQTPATLSPSARQTSRTQTIQAVVVGENVTSCSLTFIGPNPGSVTYTMTHTGNNCSQAFSNLASTTFRYTISASDGTNRSAESSEATFYVDIAGASGARKYIAATGGGGGGLPSQASSTAQQRAQGQQALSVLDGVIAKAPANAQGGLTKAKESVTKQYRGWEATKTWTSTGIGCSAGFLGLTLGPVGLITIPVGCFGGHIFGMII